MAKTRHPEVTEVSGSKPPDFEHFTGKLVIDTILPPLDPSFGSGGTRYRCHRNDGGPDVILSFGPLIHGDEIYIYDGNVHLRINRE